MILASFVENCILINLRQSFDTHEEGFFRLGPGAFRLFSVDLMEHSLQLLLENLVFGALVELADKVTSNFEGVISEIEGGAAQVLHVLVVLESRKWKRGVPCCQRDP